MQLSKETVALFKNFSNINSSLPIKAGSKVSTISTGKNIIAEAIVSENFPIDFGIYDLSEFLGALSLFDTPELEFSDKFVTIKEGKNGVKYFAADPSVITAVPTVKQFPAIDIEFDITSQMLTQIQRVASILGVPDFSVVGDGKSMVISVGDKSNPTGNSFESEIGDNDKSFRVNFKVENLKMMAGDYRVAIGGKKISRFVAHGQQLTYFVALELDSTFNW